MEVGQKQRIWENQLILHDKSPFIQIAELLFVQESSDYRWGGNFDIFYTQQNEETLIWEELQNIGYPINIYAEESLIVGADESLWIFFIYEKRGFRW